MAKKISNFTPSTYFTFFNEIGILEQLARNMFEARLPDGFLLSHFVVLNHLIRVGDGRTPLDLAKAFQVPKTTMTHTLAILLRHGLVSAIENPDDGRSKRIWITDQGRAFRQDAISEVEPDFANVAKHIPASKIAPLIPVLQDLRRALDSIREAG
jgi:DNA-binding MarR family transcriptional regulator